MAGCCDGQIVALNADSSAGRVLSASNLVMTDGNTQICDRDFDMLVVLRMNRDFMLHMSSNFFNEIKAIQPFNVTVPVEMDRASYPGVKSTHPLPNSTFAYLRHSMRT
jgi:hypothetical protein